MRRRGGAADPHASFEIPAEALDAPAGLFQHRRRHRIGNPEGRAEPESRPLHHRDAHLRRSRHAPHTPAPRAPTSKVGRTAAPTTPPPPPTPAPPPPAGSGVKMPRSGRMLLLGGGGRRGGPAEEEKKNQNHFCSR